MVQKAKIKNHENYKYPKILNEIFLIYGSTLSSEYREEVDYYLVFIFQLGTKFEAYKLPDKAMIFQPPRNKTEVLKPVNFLGKAKVNNLKSLL